MKFASLVLALGLTTSAFAASPYEMEMQNLFQTLQNNYGPYELKQKSINLDWNKTCGSAMDAVRNATHESDIYFSFADFLHELNDAHVSVTLPSSLVRTLPMQFTFAEGKVLVNYIDRANLPRSQCAVSVGDEVVRMNGKTPVEIQASQKAFRKNGNDITNMAMFARNLTQLSEARGIRMADFNQANFEFATGAGQSVNCALTYTSSGTAFIDREIPSTHNIPGPLLGLAGEKNLSTDGLWPSEPASGSNPTDGLNIPGLNSRRMKQVQDILERWHRLFNTSIDFDQVAKAGPSLPFPMPGEQGEGKRVELGGVTPFFALPADFVEIKPKLAAMPLVKLGSSMTAGTFMRNGKRVGFLRIPSYMPALAPMMSLSVRFYIGELEKQSDVLIIDQTNNPGGAVVLADLLVKGLTGKIDPAQHMTFKVKPTQGFLRQYAELINLIKEQMKQESTITPEENQAFLDRFQASYDKIHLAYTQGKSLSEPVELSSLSEYFETLMDSILARGPLAPVLTKIFGDTMFVSQVYTKPVYFMINELDFSGGDATPAMLQDYGRVKLVGVRTSGAGGTVEEFASRVNIDIKYRLTTSLMYRKGGQYVENYGVHPDMAFELTRKDIRDGFSGTFERLMTTLGI